MLLQWGVSIVTLLHGHSYNVVLIKGIEALRKLHNLGMKFEPVTNIEQILSINAQAAQDGGPSQELPDNDAEYILEDEIVALDDQTGVRLKLELMATTRK